MTLSRMLTCAVLALVVLPLPLRAQNSQVGTAAAGTSATPAATPLASTDKTLAEWAATVKPDLEAIAGAAFEKDVPVKVIVPDDLAQMLAAPIERRMTDEKARRPDGSPMSSVEIHIRAMAAAFKVATRTFGMYRYEDKTIYVVPENASRYAKRHGWSAQTLERVPRLAIAHELIHALQDQKSNLGERFTKLGGEERIALVAVTEGHAVWVVDQLAEKLDWPAANAVLWGVVTGVQTDEDAAGSDKMPRVKVNDGAPAAELYEQGRAFVLAQVAKRPEGKTPAQHAWSLVVNPPPTMDLVKNTTPPPPPPPKTPAPTP